MQPIGFICMLAAIWATTTNAACKSAPTGDRVQRYSVTTIAGEKPPVVAIAGDIRHTWVELEPKKPWPVPFVQLKGGGSFYIHWEDDKGCLRVDSNGQDFILGNASNAWRVTRK